MENPCNIEGNILKYRCLYKRELVSEKAPFGKEKWNLNDFLRGGMSTKGKKRNLNDFFGGGMSTKREKRNI